MALADFQVIWQSGLHARLQNASPACTCLSRLCTVMIQIRISFKRDQSDTDTLPEWSKGVDSSSTSASCVGSKPTAVIKIATMRDGHYMQDRTMGATGAWAARRTAPASAFNVHSASVTARAALIALPAPRLTTQRAPPHCCTWSRVHRSGARTPGLRRPGSVKLRSCLNELAVDARHWATLAPRRRRTQYKCNARQSVKPNSI